MLARASKSPWMVVVVTIRMAWPGRQHVIGMVHTFGAGWVGEAVPKRRGACRPSHAGVSITLGGRHREGLGSHRRAGGYKCYANLAIETFNL